MRVQSVEQTFHLPLFMQFPLVNCRKATRNHCVTMLTEKQPCRHLDDCPPRHYEAHYFNPFPDNDNENNLDGYTSQWSRQGLESSKFVPFTIL